MEKHQIQPGNSGVNTLADGDRWVLAAGEVVSVSDDNAFFVIGSHDNNTLVVHGTMETTGPQNTVHSKGTHTNITISEPGIIRSAASAIYIADHHCQVDNWGMIDAVLFGARFLDRSANLVNRVTGSIESDNTGVHFGGTDSSLMNYGLITGEVGVSIGATSGTFSLRNEGTISGSEYAYVGNGAQEKIINYGTFDGNVYLRSGSDTFISHGGAVNGNIYGGNGNDRYFIGSDTLNLIEAVDGGIDTVFTIATHTLANFIENLTLTGVNALNGTGNALNNRLTGNSADNILSGLDGRDTLSGAEGNDTLDGGAAGDTLSGDIGNDILSGGGGFDRLNGGAGSDELSGDLANDVLVGGGGRDRLIGGSGNDRLTGGYVQDHFVFGEASGLDIITDFNARGVQHDVLDISAWTEVVSFYDLKRHHMQRAGTDVVITDGSNRIVLEDVNIADLGKTDFLF